MSLVKKIVQDSLLKVKVDELLAEEYEPAGYGGITLTKTPLGTQINLYAMRPGRVIGKRGTAIRQASARLENELHLPNPQITVVEVKVPELDPRIMAARIANALERGIHYRRALFWSLRRTMESGALGCEILLKGKLRSDRGRYEKVVDGYIPKAGEPTQRYVRRAVIQVKQKKGTFGVTVVIVPPDAKFPDKVDLSGLPVIEYPEDEIELPKGTELDAVEGGEALEEDLSKQGEGLGPLTTLEHTQDDAENTLVTSVSTEVETTESSEAIADISAEVSEPEILTQSIDNKSALSPGEIVSDASKVTEEKEKIQESSPVKESPTVKKIKPPAEPDVLKVEDSELTPKKDLETITIDVLEVDTLETRKLVDSTIDIESSKELALTIEECPAIEKAPKVKVAGIPEKQLAADNIEASESLDNSETKKKE